MTDESTNNGREDIISQFLNVTGATDPNLARQFLEMSGNKNDLEMAVGLYMEMNADIHNAAADEDNVGVEFQVPLASVESGTNRIDEEDNEILSEPDYDFLAVEEEDVGDTDYDYDYEQQQMQNMEDDLSDDEPSSPEYDHLGLDDYEQEISAYDFPDVSCGNNDLNTTSSHEQNQNANEPSATCAGENELMYYAQVEDEGGEYILGTLMVRVLQAKNLKSNPHNEGGGIGGLLSKHRRFRHHKSSMSPASGGQLTPSSYYASQHQQLYAKLSFKDQLQITSMALEHASTTGDYHWSRGDQSYFDVTCPSFPLRMGSNTKMMVHQHPSKQSLTSSTSPQKNVSCTKPKSNHQQQPSNSTEKRRPAQPVLQLSLFSRKGGAGGTNHKQKKLWQQHMNNSKDDGDSAAKNEDYLVGKCSINILRILSGKTPYFDEWCTIHNDANFSNDESSAAGRVRIVIEYEPADPPPRPGDMCAFANVYPLMDELYPVPLQSIRNTIRPVRSSMSMSTLSSTSSSTGLTATYTPSLTCQPKTYRVEEVVGDHVVLSYTTPIEKWQCTFEVHRYLLMCTERHQAAVEKYREHVLDLCDNISQSPAVHTLAKTVENIPEEGLVYVAADAVEGGVGLLGRWWEHGVDGIVEDVVDGINLDGRYSHLLDDEEGDSDNNHVHDNMVQSHSNALGIATAADASSIIPDDRKAMSGMPCCPITAQPMIEPVVAADGHTYERYAIARWLQTSNRSPLTGGILAHAELVPNYLLLSSFSDGVDGREPTASHVNAV